MPASTPETLHVDRQCLIVLTRVLRAVDPEEGCALLLGERCGPLWRLRRIWPCCNVWPQAEARRRRFAIDPREQLLAQKWARTQQLDVLGAAHRHPDSAAVPSLTDRALAALRPTLMLIADPEGRCRAWWLPEGDREPLPLPLVCEG